MRVPVKRQTMIALAKPSIAESRPKPISATEPARIPRGSQSSPRASCTPGSPTTATSRASRDADSLLSRSTGAVPPAGVAGTATGVLIAQAPRRGTAVSSARPAAVTVYITILPSRRLADQAGAANAEVMGHEVLRSLADPRDVTHAQLVGLRQRDCDDQPRRVTERLAPAARSSRAAPSADATRGAPRPWAGRGKADHRCPQRPASILLPRTYSRFESERFSAGRGVPWVTPPSPSRVRMRSSSICSGPRFSKSRRPWPKSTGTRWISTSSRTPAASASCAMPAPWTRRPSHRGLLGLGHRGRDVVHVADQRPLPRLAAGVAAVRMKIGTPPWCSPPQPPARSKLPRPATTAPVDMNSSTTWR